MKHIITIPRKERLSLNDLEIKIRDARNSNDYIMVNFANNTRFIKIAFSKDQTYTIGHNITNLEFLVKTNMMVKQYARTVNNKLADYLFDWVNSLNR